MSERTASTVARCLVEAIRTQFADATTTSVRPALDAETQSVATLAITDGVKYGYGANSPNWVSPERAER